MRIDTSGNASDIPLGSWSISGDCNGANTAAPTNAYVITNADQGALVTWQLDTGTNTPTGQSRQTSYYIATTRGTSLVSSNTMPRQITPVLQAQDGTFFGTDSGGSTVLFDQTGNIKWSVGDSPQEATADNGVVGASGTVYDGNGRATGQTSLAIPSWTGETAYEYGSTDEVINTQPPPATPPYAAFQYLNKSHNSVSPPCHDDRDQFMPEYVTFPADFVPSCQEFKNAETYGMNEVFSFSRMNQSDIARNDHPNWALLESSMLNGLQVISVDYDSALTVTSAYRSPFVQYQVTKETCAKNNQNPCHQYPLDRHIHGDAVDVDAGDRETWQTLHDIGKSAAVHACVEPWQAQATYDEKGNVTNNPWNHVHFDWRSDASKPCPIGGRFGDW